MDPYPQLCDDTSLLFPFTSQTFSDPSPFFPSIFQTLRHSSRKSLTIVCVTPASALDGSQLYDVLRRNPRENWKGMQKFLGGIYATLAAAQWDSGRVLMDVEVRFDSEFSLSSYDQEITDGQTIAFEGYESLSRTYTASNSLPPLTATLPFPHYTTSHTLSSAPGPSPGPSTAALGGTFDHLHAAHKLLLHLSLFLATRKLIVGLMADSLLSSKSNASLVQPFHKRARGVADFLSRCGARKRGEDGQGVVMDVVEIYDALGPTAWDPDIDALVVSTETLSGGEMVNSTRRGKGLPELELFVIDVIASTLAPDEDESGRRRKESTASVKTVDLSEERDEKKLKELKMGSTAIRQWLVDRGKDT